MRGTKGAGLTRLLHRQAEPGGNSVGSLSPLYRKFAVLGNLIILRDPENGRATRESLGVTILSHALTAIMSKLGLRVMEGLTQCHSAQKVNSPSPELVSPSPHTSF